MIVHFAARHWVNPMFTCGRVATFLSRLFLHPEGATFGIRPSAAQFMTSYLHRDLPPGIHQRRWREFKFKTSSVASTSGNRYLLSSLTWRPTGNPLSSNRAKFVWGVTQSGVPFRKQDHQPLELPFVSKLKHGAISIWFLFPKKHLPLQIQGAPISPTAHAWWLETGKRV